MAVLSFRSEDERSPTGVKAPPLAGGTGGVGGSGDDVDDDRYKSDGDGDGGSESSLLMNLTALQKLHLLIEEPESSTAAKLWSHFIIWTVLASITGFVLQSVEELQDLLLWFVLDVCSFVIFSGEYALRLASCSAFGDMTRKQFVKAPGNIVDLMSVVPVFLFEDVEAVRPFKVFRAVRLVRIFRVFKLSKYSTGMTMMAESVVGSAKPLCILNLLLGIAVMFFSSLVYHLERLSCPGTKEMTDIQFASYRAECDELRTGWAKDGSLCCDRRDTPDDFESIAAAWWWCLVTMTTVGYGGKVPRTLLGRIVGCVAMVTGIVLISLPVAIVGTNFQQAYADLELQQQQEAKAKSGVVRGTSYTSSTSTCMAGTKTTASDMSVSSNGGSPRGKDAAAAASEDGSGKPVRREGQLNYRDLRALQEKLRILEGRRKLSLAARKQVGMLIELCEHLERVDKRLEVLQSKDRELEVCIQEDFAVLARSYNSLAGQANSTSNVGA